jgi:hypothetical protein
MNLNEEKFEIAGLAQQNDFKVSIFVQFAEAGERQTQFLIGQS